jgi:hypothetical protein
VLSVKYSEVLRKENEKKGDEKKGDDVSIEEDERR